MSSHYAASGALAEATPLASHADTGWSDQDITIVTDYLTSLPTVTFASVLHVGGHPDNISFVDRQGWGVPVTRTPDLYAQCYDQRHAIWSAITRRHAQPLQFIDSNTITHQPADTAELYRIAETVGLVTEEIMWVLHHPQSLPYAVTSHTVATSATKIDPNVTIKREPWFVPTERFLVHDHHASVNSAGVNDILAQLLHIYHAGTPNSAFDGFWLATADEWDDDDPFVDVSEGLLTQFTQQRYSVEPLDPAEL